MDLTIKRLKENAILPQRATAGSAGYDIFSCIEESIIIKPHEIVKVPTGLAVALEDNTAVILIYARSGLASKHGITLANCVGVVDSDYRGELLVPLINLSDEYYTIEPDQRIAQLVITPIFLPNIIESDTLPETTRGTNGFGSSGR